MAAAVPPAAPSTPPIPEGKGWRYDVLFAALVRELQGAWRSQIEAEKQGRHDWGRHFDRMQKRLATALGTVDMPVFIAHPASEEAGPPRGAPAPLAPEVVAVTDAMVEAAFSVYGMRAGRVSPNDSVDGHKAEMRKALCAALAAAAATTPEVIAVDRATAERAADHLDAEADALRDSHIIRGAWSESPDDAEREAKSDHDSMRSCAAALRAKL